MTLDLILPWFPIVLAVGVGSRLLGRAHGTGFGLLGAVFWLALLLAGDQPAMLTPGWPLVSALAGAVAIVAMGTWSASESASALRGHDGRRGFDAAAGSGTRGCEHPSSDVRRDDASIVGALRRYDDWLEAHRHCDDPWPEFGEFVRSLLFGLCGATHVRPYRILSEGDGLVPLRAIEPGEAPEVLSARRGIVGHVASTGTTYLAVDSSHGQLIDDLAEASGEQIAWCFAVCRGPDKIGLVKVARLDPATRRDALFLETVERLIGQFWTTLADVCRSRTAETRDPASGLHTREPFLFEADRALSAAYADGEPVVLAILAIEGLRTLTDQGDWQLADALIAETSQLLRDRVRADDRLGRFDDSRFCILLRRVDSALGSLIVDQLLGKVTEICNHRRWAVADGTITARCGVAGSGTDKPKLAELISRATAQCRQARQQVVPISSDLSEPRTLVRAD